MPYIDLFISWVSLLLPSWTFRRSGCAALVLVPWLNVVWQRGWGVRTPCASLSPAHLDMQQGSEF